MKITIEFDNQEQQKLFYLFAEDEFNEFIDKMVRVSIKNNVNTIINLVKSVRKEPDNGNSN